MSSTLISAGLLADGLSSSSQQGRAVLVRDGRIAAVDQAEVLLGQADGDTQQVDLGSACLGPGLIDGHTHLSLAGDGRSYSEQFSDSDEMMVLIGAMNLQRHLRAGITTVREHGARNRVGFALKEGWERGYIGGSRMLVSGRPITCTGGHFHMCNEVADGEAEVRRSVRRLVHEGADYIKIMASGGGTAGTIPGRASYSVAELHAIVHEAHHLGRLTAAHCRAKESMVRAVEAGIDLMEHAEFLDPDGQLRFDPALAEMMAESDIWISPTLQAWTGYGRIVALRQQRDSGTGDAAAEAELAALEKRAEGRLDLVRRMLDYGLKERIVPGTDSGVGNLEFGHLDYDLQLLVEVGFTPAEAFASATRISAQACGAEGEVGTIEVGKIADLTAFDGDPNEDVGACSRVVAVFQEGQRVV
ncbi:MAG: amidohydrolase family protein [Candidatus Latescibacteria bacterium]|nr:amidohydrolase family protein [Candidatus Latescibacterota bacterium]